MNAPLKHYLAYLRPRCFLPTYMMAFTGYVLGWDSVTPARSHYGNLALLLLLHCVLLWGSANAYNSSQDRDIGPVNLLPDPPPLPKHLVHFSLFLKCMALLLAAVISLSTLMITTAAVALSLFYSTRCAGFRRGKEIPVLDILINAVGCGLISIALGYSFTNGPFNVELLAVGLSFSVAIFGGLPTSQIFQLDPKSSYREERNYTSWLGPARTLRVGSLMLGIHLLLLGWGLPDLAGPLAHPLARSCWWGWAGCVTIALIHSWWWSSTPLNHAYQRMLRQFTLMMISQVLWTTAVWIG